MSDNPLAHYHRLLDLLRQEKEADYRSFLELVREKPLSDRVEQGYTWYPLNVLSTGFALGDKAFVVVERTARIDEPHQLRAGQTVSLFTQAEHTDQPEKQGVINYVERNRMKIVLNARDVPDWLNAGQLGVDMLFDDRSYREMERALNQVLEARGNRLAELRRLLAPGNPASVAPHRAADQKISEETEGGLNASQRAAVQAVLANRDVAVIHGPPGTGKTTTLVAAVQELVKTESTVLVAAPSNTAADLLTERLAAAGLNVVRVGNISRIDEQVLEHTVDALLAAHPEAKNIKKIKIEAAEYRRQARRFKRHFNAEARRERAHLKDQARELEAWARALEDRLVDEILDGAQAITCTLVGAAHPLLDKRHFRSCVIDEAAQALEPACWIPIAKCSRLVLAGDPFQLPPTVKDLDAARQGLAVTLIERCLDLLPDQVHLLTVQYRMHRAIMGFSNQYFYGGALQAHADVAERVLLAEAEPLPSITFIDTAGCGFEERMQESPGALHRSLSRFNPEEALLLREHLLQLPIFDDHTLQTSNSELQTPNSKLQTPNSKLQTSNFKLQTPNSKLQTPNLSIGILSPYREQVNHLEALFRNDPQLAPLLPTSNQQPVTSNQKPSNQKPSNQKPQISINTIDGFQGQERDIVYLSLVRSNAKHEIGFLQDYRRMNVAMTRARLCLVVIGDSATIGNNKFYQAFLDYVAEHGAYRTAWEFMG